MKAELSSSIQSWTSLLFSRDAGLDSKEINDLHVKLSKRQASLVLDNVNSLAPNPDQALVHLKLLHAFTVLRTSISERDGLFGLFNEDIIQGLSNSTQEPRPSEASLLLEISQRRWSIFVARAVSRFTCWWQTLRRENTPGMLSMETFQSPKESQDWLEWKNGGGAKLSFSPDNLPPLDVLMVWHSYMLNPQRYLEDCLRYGLMALWHTEFPWSPLNAALDERSGNYQATPAAISAFERQTLVDWSNVDVLSVSTMTCPACREPFQCSPSAIRRDDVVSWAQEAETGATFPENFGSTIDKIERCHNKQCRINTALFRLDYFNPEQYLPADGVSSEGTSRKSSCRSMDKYRLPFRGSVLAKNGTMESIKSLTDPRLEVNRILHSAFEARVSDADCEDLDPTSVISGVLEDRSLFKDTADEERTKHIIRNILSLYEETSGPFSLDLTSAVLRQGLFITKMESEDWLHSPAALATMARLASKYVRFFTLMCSRLQEVTVPTIDVDLLWHTNQLGPAKYYELCLRSTNPPRFIDHNDRIGKPSLEDYFGKTMKAYKLAFNLPYGQCTCWECESANALEEPAVAALFMPDALLSNVKDVPIRGASRLRRTFQRVSTHKTLALIDTRVDEHRT